MRGVFQVGYCQGQPDANLLHIAVCETCLQRHDMDMRLNLKWLSSKSLYPEVSEEWHGRARGSSV